MPDILSQCCQKYFIYSFFYGSCKLNPKAHSKNINKFQIKQQMKYCCQRILERDRFHSCKKEGNISFNRIYAQLTLYEVHIASVSGHRVYRNLHSFRVVCRLSPLPFSTFLTLTSDPVNQQGTFWFSPKRIPAVSQQLVKHSELQPVWHQQPSLESPQTSFFLVLAI